MKMKPPSGPKKQTQTNPISSKAKMNLKSLNKKSGHTLLDGFATLELKYDL